MLILFDIDGTLLRTEGAGMTAMLSAARDLYPEHSFSFDGISISGRLDRLIWRDLMSNAGVEPTTHRHDAFRHAYGEHLRRGFDDTSRSMALGGAIDLVQALSDNDDYSIGLLTGNYEHTGRLKVAHAGFDLAHFKCNAWADDGEHRRDLPMVAMERHRLAHGKSIDPSQVVIVGDTPLDIDCAHFNGCNVIAVATGHHPLGELAGHEPDLLLPGLEDWKAIVSWMSGR